MKSMINSYLKLLPYLKDDFGGDGKMDGWMGIKEHTVPKYYNTTVDNTHISCQRS